MSYGTVNQRNIIKLDTISIGNVTFFFFGGGGGVIIFWLFCLVRLTSPSDVRSPHNFACPTKILDSQSKMSPLELSLYGWSDGFVVSTTNRWQHLMYRQMHLHASTIIMSLRTSLHYSACQMGHLRIDRINIQVHLPCREFCSSLVRLNFFK